MQATVSYQHKCALCQYLLSGLACLPTGFVLPYSVIVRLPVAGTSDPKILGRPFALHSDYCCYCPRLWHACSSATVPKHVQMAKYLGCDEVSMRIRQWLAGGLGKMCSAAGHCKSGYDCKDAIAWQQVLQPAPTSESDHV